jgi:putative selenate reductase
VYSFSAGIDQHNFAPAAAADLYPVTTCTDLLRPGGYGRLPKYLDNLAEEMTKAKATTIERFVLSAHGEAKAAMREAKDPILKEARRVHVSIDEAALLRAADTFEGSRDPRASLSAAGLDERAIDLVLPLWVHQAGTRNTRRLAEAALEDPRYKKDANTKVPKKIGSTLALFDCVNCDKCVPVCPNDANFAYDVAPLSIDAPTWILDNGSVAEGPRTKVQIEETHQLATFVDFCNACGNCDVFCPEDGGPYVMKPHWFGSVAALEAEARIDGFVLESKDVIVGRIQKRRVRLALDRTRRIAVFEDDAIEAKVRFVEGGLELLSHRTKRGRGELRGADLFVLRALLEGVMSTVNPVSIAFDAR